MVEKSNARSLLNGVMCRCITKCRPNSVYCYIYRPRVVGWNVLDFVNRVLVLFLVFYRQLDEFVLL